MHAHQYKWLAVLPAIAVFALLIGALPAGSTANKVSVPLAPSNARDAWDVPIAKPGELPADMRAVTALSERDVPISEAEFKMRVERRGQMPATKAPVAFFPETYDDYLKANAKSNRLRFTRFWVSHTTDASLANELLYSVTPPAIHCAEHTWAYAQELTVSFEVSSKLTGTNVVTDGPPALSECFEKELARWKTMGPSNAKTKPGSKLVMSFVVMKV